jgi:cytochrome b pre-mRNA-processing protein 3
MIAGFFRRANARRRAVEGLHLALSMAARRPGLYTRLGVPDTVEGRFEALCLHAILVLRRLNRLPAPAAEVAQDLVNSVFTQLDASLRELGVGDMGVAKRMKKLGAAFYGRAEGYDAALNAGDAAALAAALVRNVLGGEGDGTGLAAYVQSADTALAGVDLDGLFGAALPFPEPDGFAPLPGAAGDRAGDRA